MKLLFDQNLSPRLALALQDVAPGSRHVRDVGLASAGDDELWTYAVHFGFAIVSKDAVFRQRSFLFGPPPKVIWISRGAASTTDIERLLRLRRADLDALERDARAAFLIVG